MENIMDNQQQLDDNGFWNKVGSIAGSAAYHTVTKALTLYYVYSDPATPRWAKAVIVGALAYLVSPFDLIPDMLPGGYADDAGVLAKAMGTVGLFIQSHHRNLAHQRWMILTRQQPAVDG